MKPAAGSELNRVSARTPKAIAAEKEAAEKAAKAASKDALAQKMSAGGLIHLAGSEPAPAADSSKPASIMVGDGGAAWRARALRRAQQTASETGQDVRAVVAEHHGVCYLPSSVCLLTSV